MQRLEVSGAERPIYGSLGVKRLIGENGQTITKKDDGRVFNWILPALTTVKVSFYIYKLIDICIPLLMCLCCIVLIWLIRVVFFFKLIAFVCILLHNCYILSFAELLLALSWGWHAYLTVWRLTTHIWVVPHR